MIKSNFWLTYLELSGNLKIGDEGIMNLTNLRSLSLPIRATDRGLIGLTNLTYLKLNQKITNNSLSKLVTLKTLDIDYNSRISIQGIQSLLKLKNVHGAYSSKNSHIKEEIKKIHKA
jgi:Leucine-rich repeat (LRR) protein